MQVRVLKLSGRKIDFLLFTGQVTPRRLDKRGGGNGLTCRSVRVVEKHPSNFRYRYIQPAGYASWPRVISRCLSSRV